VTEPSPDAPARAASRQRSDPGRSTDRDCSGARTSGEDRERHALADTDGKEKDPSVFMIVSLRHRSSNDSPLRWHQSMISGWRASRDPSAQRQHSCDGGLVSVPTRTDSPCDVNGGVSSMANAAGKLSVVARIGAWQRKSGHFKRRGVDAAPGSWGFQNVAPTLLAVLWTGGMNRRSDHQLAICFMCSPGKRDSECTQVAP
jgi:hypothetical protein